MADVNATFNYDADFSSAITQTRLLSRELSVLNNSFNSLDKDARKVRDRFAEVFKADVGNLGAFSAKTVDITSNMDNFGKSLDRNKLKLRDYAREARRAFQADSNSRKLAEDQVRRTKANLVEIGMDASGRRKGILVTPLKLDMSDMQTQIEVARKQFSIFNRLVNDGATQLINWGKNTQWAGRQLTVGLTVPMTIFATTTIKAFNDVDRELTRFQKVYGSDLVGSTTEATNIIRQQVQALAVDIAGSYGIAAKETAGLAADLAATGLEGQKLLESIKQTTRLSVLGEIDRQDAMKTTLSLQNAFKMSTEELADSINFLNAVENQTSLSLQDLTEAIPKVGPVVRALGGDVKDLSVLMVAMKEGGINAAEGANALKSGLASLINPTKAGSAVAKQYGIDLESIVEKNKGQLLPTVLEFQQSMQTLDDLGKAKIIEQLFGKYQFARISALFDNLNAAGSQTQQVIELMSASNSDLARIANSEIKTLTESASMRFQRSMEAIKAALLPVGEAIVNSVLPFMERFAGVLDKIVSFAQNLPGPIKSFIKSISGITLVAGPIIMMAGVLGNFAGYIIKGAMAFVNLGRIMRGLPVERFSLLDDTQIAAAKATDTVTISIEKQKSAMVGLNKLMMDYYMLVNKQASRTPGLFNQMPPTPTIGGSPVVPSGARTLPVIRRQSGGSAWVPGSGSGDKIPALLEPGEFVINRNAAKQYGGVLEDINNGVPRFATGGKMPRKIPIPRYRLGATGLAALRLRRQQQSNASAVSNTSRLAELDTMSVAARPNNMTGMQALLRDSDTRPARQPAQQAAQQPNPGGQPLRYGSEDEYFHPRLPSGYSGPQPFGPDDIAYSNITFRRQFQARQANEQVSVIMSRLQNANNSQELVDSIPEIIRNVQIVKSIRIRGEGETKPFPTDSTFPMPKPLNTIYNDIIPGKSSDTSTFSSILTRIADTDELTLAQKKSLFALVSNGDAPGDPQLISFMSTVFRGVLDEGLPSNFSKNVAAKMALSATVPAEFIAPLKPMSTRLGEGLVYQSTDRSISGLPNTSEWQVASRELGLESLPLTSQVTASDKATDLLAKSLGIDEDAAKILIQAQKIGEFHVSHAQSGGVIRAIRGIKMPESYATKLATIRQSMANANKEAMSSNVPLTELGIKQSRIGGHSSAIPGVNGVYDINGQRYVVKGHDTYDSAKAEADMARITRDVFGLQTPNQEVVRVRHPETGDLMFAVRSPYNDTFANSTGTFSEGSVFNQIVASAVRRDKDLQAGNLWDDVVADVGQAGIMSRASQPRTKTGATNSVLEQLAINLGMVKGGARSHGAEGWNATTSSMTDEQIARGIKQAAQEAKSRITTADIPEDFAYIARDLDDIISSDLGPFIAHLRTVTPKVKKPPTAAAIAKKEQQKLLDREERQAALDAGYPAWAMQSGGIIRAQSGGLIRAMFGMRIPKSKNNTPYSGQVASSLTPKVSKRDQDLLDLYFDKPQVGHLDNLQKTPLGEIAGRGMVPSQTLYRGMSDFDMSLVKQSGTLTRDSVMSTTRDRDAAIKIASGLSDSGGGNTYSVAKIKVGRGTRGVHLNSLVPRARQSLDEILLSPQTPLHFRRSEIGYRINTGESIIPVMQHVFSTKKPNIIQRLYDRILQSRQSELRPLTREEVRYWQQAGAPLTEGMQLVANRGKTIYGDNYEENYQRAQSSKRVEELAAAERARKASLTPEESRAEYLANQARIAERNRTSTGVQTGGIIRAQGGAWVPGKGEGDRVPALLEPGEFVVNKKAAKQYGGVLEDMNWNLAPRFMRGTPKSGESNSMASMPGMGMGALSGAGMAVGMLTSMAGLPPMINNVILGFSALTGIMSAFQMIMMKNNATAAAGAAGNAGGGMAGMLKSPKAALARLGPMLANPWVLATAAIGATAFAVYKYRDSIKQAGKDGKAIFDSQTEAAKELGVELKTTTQNMEAISGNFDALQPKVKSPSILTAEQRDAIAGTDQNKRLIEQLKNTQDAQGILLAQYSRMILDGMMPEEAMAIVKLLAERSGKSQDFFKAAPEMGAIGNEENPQKQFNMAMGTFTGALGSLGDRTKPTVIPQQQGIDYSQGNNTVYYDPNMPGVNMTAPRNPNLDPSAGQQFVPVGTDTVTPALNSKDKATIKGGITGALGAAEMAPDMSSYIKGMQELSKAVSKLNEEGKDVGLEAISEFAKTKYGEESSFFKAFDTLPDNLNTVENKLMLITAESAGVNLDEFLMDGELAKEEIDAINQKLKQTGINAEIDLRIKNAASAQLEKIQKQSIAVQSSYDSSIAKNEQLVDAENERYKKAGKAHQEFIKAKQKEIDSIDKQADKEIEAINKTSSEFLKALSENDRQSEYLSQQRQTAIGGLGALAGGDIFGFMQSQEKMQSDATSFAYDNEIAAVEENKNKEIEAIEEVRKKRVEALKEDIDKRQEAAEKEDEKHEKRLKQLEEQRVAAQTNYTQAMTELQKQEVALQNISTYTGPDFAKMVAGYEGTASMAVKVAAAEVAITALSQGKSVDEAIKAGQDYLNKNALSSSDYNNKILKDSGYSGAGMILQAEGGYIQGPGTATSDSIPARLSNGEYVVKASSVSKYGVGMMNSINEQKFARGGVVGSSDPVDDYSRVRYGNKTFNARTVRMLKRAEEKYGSPFEFYQGSYSTNVKASMGTHDGGGAVDIKPPSNVTKALTALSQAGFWAKWRDKMKPPHIHAIAYGDKELSAAARKQLGLPADYKGDPVEGPQDSIANITAALSALGTNIATVNTVRSKGVRGLMNPRQFGGSMTMNKPYLVGEKGPEVFLPYGAGGKISPISYDVPQNTTGMATQTAAIAGGITTQESSNVYYNVNVDASATNNPRDVANYVIRALKQEENRRSFSRRIS
jgi:TP901 family phage tail tape measure protein